MADSIQQASGATALDPADIGDAPSAGSSSGGDAGTTFVVGDPGLAANADSGASLAPANPLPAVRSSGDAADATGSAAPLSGSESGGVLSGGTASTVLGGDAIAILGFDGIAPSTVFGTTVTAGGSAVPFSGPVAVGPAVAGGGDGTEPGSPNAPVLGAGATMPTGITAAVSSDIVTAAGLASGPVEGVVAGGGATSAASIGAVSGAAAFISTGSGGGDIWAVTGSGGLTFDISFDQSASALPTGFESAVIAAFQFYADEFKPSGNTSGVTLHYNVGYGELDGSPLAAGDLGESYTFFGASQTYATLSSTLSAHANSAADKAAVANDLPATDPTGGKTLDMAVAEEKALGLTSGNPASGPGSSFSNPDGDIGFSSSFTFNYDLNRVPISGEYDFIGTVEHEISEVMGRDSWLHANGTSDYGPMDLFRFSGSGTHQFTKSDPSYFSLDAGKTDLYNWNNFTTGNTGDLGDWAATSPYTPDSYNDNSNPGVINPITSRDTTLMDVIGWDRTNSATYTVSAGNTSRGIIVYSDDEEHVESGGKSVDTYALSGGIEVVSAGGSDTSATFSSGAVQDVFGSANTTILAGGFQVVESGGRATSTTITNGGSATVASGGTTHNPTIDGFGAVLDLQSGAIVSGGVTFSGSGGRLDIHGSAMPSNTIFGFVSGDAFDLADIAFDSHGSAILVSSGSVQNQLQVTEGGNTYDLNLDPTQTFSNDFFHLASNGSGGTLITENQLATTTTIVDVIPVGDSAEAHQNSEPSFAVNPNDPTQIIAGAFAFFSGGGVITPFVLTVDGGGTWTTYDTITTLDKSLAWKTDGSAIVAATLTTGTDITTYSGTISSSGFGTPINTFATVSPDDLDQPWIGTGPSNHVYVAYNDLNNTGSGAGQGKTASVNVSTDGGNTFTPVVLDRVGQTSGGPGQDAPSVRLAVNGNTVYAAFTRWDSVFDSDANGYRYQSHVIVVRSDNGGADSFTALGTGGNGSTVAQPLSPYTSTDNSPLSLGQERIGSDLAIAVDPSNADHLVVAYEEASGSINAGIIQLVVTESSDAGATWITKFTTSSATRSALPALAILSDGTIGLLYGSYDPVSDKLSQHLLQTADDFATTADSVLATESNATPALDFDPYVGDFFDLQGVGHTFYGIFSASNADNGTDALFSTVTFQRDFIGSPGTAGFQLTDGSGQNVSASIDPFFFTAADIACFLRGTLIWTERGELPVEDLAIGDEVVILSGESRPIKWIGRRAYDGRFVTANRNVLPIRIEAGALADGVPMRDLRISPEHALYIDGALVPAGLLVNGATIRQVEEIERLEYFHIELDTHEVILAEGAPAESFVDCNNRFMFQNGDEFARLYPGDRRPAWEFCARRLEAGSLELTAVRAALLERAAVFGDRLTDDPDLHLIVDGEIVRAQAADGDVYSFTIPAGSGAICLASRSAIPAEVEASSQDRRRLGVSVKRIVLREPGLRTAIGHAHPSLRDGFHGDENGHRWTDGMARLPEELVHPFAADVTVEVHLLRPGFRYPLAPGASVTPVHKPLHDRRQSGDK